MKIDLSTPLVLALRDEYPGCFQNADCLREFVEEVLWLHLEMNRSTRRCLAEMYPDLRRDARQDPQAGEKKS